MKVTIYSKQNCTYCSKAKVMLDNLGIEYTEKKLEEFKTENILQKYNLQN